MRIAIATVGVILLTCRLLACTGSQVAAGFDVAGHTAALEQCRAEGKDAGSYAVYGRCADEADRKYIPDGGAK